jgi:hypothetical protein
MQGKDYSEEDLEIIYALDYVKEHPEMFLPKGHISGMALASAILDDIFVQERVSTFVERIGEWWLIGSEFDWIGPYMQGYTLHEYFSRMVGFPEMHVNAVHSEVLLTAFAADVIVFDNSGHERITGTTTLDDLILAARQSHPEFKRAVAFRMDR